jgi:4-diphosphocytidyl-2-C-methyl-D-erythritol kinase
MLIKRGEEAGWEITVPAKLNLFLEVLGKRPDGYHELDTIMAGISLVDRLIVKPTSNAAIDFSVRSLNSEGFVRLDESDAAWEVPADQSNLVLKALESLRRELGIKDGLAVELWKGIPSQAGLGGGSGDAAAALVAGQLAWTRAYDPALASRLAKPLGSDIHFFLEGKADAGSKAWLARCTGRGEIVEPIRNQLSLNAVVVQPSRGCSTRDIFHKLSELPSSGRREVDSATFFGPKLTGVFFNRLEEAAGLVNPQVCQLRRMLEGFDEVLGCCLTGSGSAVFATVADEETAVSLHGQILEIDKVRAYAIKPWGEAPIIDQIRTLLT